jgi:hypothetical protein
LIIHGTEETVDMELPSEVVGSMKDAPPIHTSVSPPVKSNWDPQRFRRPPLALSVPASKRRRTHVPFRGGMAKKDSPAMIWLAVAPAGSHELPGRVEEGITDGAGTAGGSAMTSSHVWSAGRTPS